MELVKTVTSGRGERIPNDTHQYDAEGSGSNLRELLSLVGMNIGHRLTEDAENSIRLVNTISETASHNTAAHKTPPPSLASYSLETTLINRIYLQ